MIRLISCFAFLLLILPALRGQITCDLPDLTTTTARELRAEGLTEQIGDIHIVCHGVPITPSGKPVPQI